MTNAEWLTIIAILVGPLIALHIQKWIENYKEEKDRKLNIFKTLMTTRGAKVSFEHVRALNMIDIEFNKHKAVSNAWKCYLDILYSPQENNMGLWVIERDKLFIDLLDKMGEAVGYQFDKVHLSKSIYTPKAHGEEEEYQYWLREQFKKIFSGEQSISIKIENNALDYRTATDKQD